MRRCGVNIAIDLLGLAAVALCGFVILKEVLANR